MVRVQQWHVNCHDDHTLDFATFVELMPPCLPIPILSIIRRFLAALSTCSWNVTIIRSLTFPNFGYTLAGWRTEKIASGGSNSDSSDSPEPQSLHPEPKGDIRPPEFKKGPPEFHYELGSPISRLMSNPTLFDPLRKPRNPIVLCHGAQETPSVTFRLSY